MMLRIQPEFIIYTILHTLRCFINRITSWMPTSHLIEIRITLPTKKDMPDLRDYFWAYKSSTMTLKVKSTERTKIVLTKIWTKKKDANFNIQLVEIGP
jgi:hypothetical protein